MVLMVTFLRAGPDWEPMGEWELYRTWERVGARDVRDDGRLDDDDDDEEDGDVEAEDKSAEEEEEKDAAAATE